MIKEVWSMKGLINLLEELCSVKSVSGREENISKYIQDEIGGLADSVGIDKNGNVIARIHGSGSGLRKNIMLDAHIDQIGFIVTYINDEGFLKVGSCGGMDYRIVQDTRFKVLTDSGEITAVACCMPPHLSDGGEDKAPAADDIYLDTGLSVKRVRELVRVGDTVAFDISPTLLLNDRFTCCSTDNRAGCAVLFRVAQLIKGSPIADDVTLAFTVQEETFGKGASAAAYTVQPDAAIAVDVSFAASKGVSPAESGKLGGGGMVCISPVLSREMSDKLTAVAREKGIPCQFEVTGGLTGTNADKISVSRSGVPTAVVSVPQSSMHTSAEIVAAEDIENTARLIFEYLSAGV